MADASSKERLADAVLLSRIADGDRHAFAVLVRRHGERVRGLALAFTGRAADADDITQDVYLRLWRQPLAWRPGSARFTTWLHRVVANRCLDHARRQRLRAWLPFAEAANEIDDPSPSALATLADRDHLAAVWRALQQLPDKQRIALLLASQQAQTTAEIAQALGISEGAVEQRLVRARRTLRTLIDRMEEPT